MQNMKPEDCGEGELLGLRSSYEREKLRVVPGKEVNGGPKGRVDCMAL